MPTPNSICKVINEFPTEQLLCCDENNCRTNEVSLTCDSHEYLTNCHEISDLETCQQTEQGTGPVCQYKNDKNKLLCLWAEKEPTHPDGRALSERNFTDGPYALIHQRQRAWMLDRRKLKESNLGSSWACCDAEKCNCCVANINDCTNLPQKSTAIWCHPLFNPILNINAPRHCAFGGVEGINNNDTAVGFFLNYSGQVCDKEQGSPVSPITTSSFLTGLPNTPINQTNGLGAGEITGIIVGIASFIVGVAGLFIVRKQLRFGYRQHRQRHSRRRESIELREQVNQEGNSD
jgi:hypothetical protein